MFPERQMGPHRDWKQEVEYLDRIFANGSAYTIGKVNGDHWLLYMTGAAEGPHQHHYHHVEEDRHPDYTIEILMSDLSAKARQPFFFGDAAASSGDTPVPTPAEQAAELSERLGITAIFPPELTTLDAYAFDPCGYSSNALIKWGHGSLEDSFAHVEEATENGSTATSANGVRAVGPHAGEGYYTIHVTPEEGWSYASFECNVPLSSSSTSLRSTKGKGKIPDLQTLIQRVVRIFEPGRITVTLFISSEDNEAGGGLDNASGSSVGDDDESESAVEAAQRAFRAALAETSIAIGAQVNGSVNGKTHRSYKRTDKINYEFGGYDLAFASFELR